MGEVFQSDDGEFSIEVTEHTIELAEWPIILRHAAKGVLAVGSIISGVVMRNPYAVAAGGVSLYDAIKAIKKEVED